MDAYDAFGLVVGCAMLAIAAAQWLASRYVDRQAMRLFAFRFFVAGVGWIMAHPQAHLGPDPQLPWPPLLVALALQVLTIHALDIYLGQSARARRLGLALAAAVALGGLALGRAVWPGSAAPVYAVIVIGMSWCAWQAARATRRERNAGHAWVAAAFASYPVFVLLAWVRLGGNLGHGDLSYAVALPSAIVGITILVVSLIRAVTRTQVALAEREAAQRALQQFNATLEQRVAQRTSELRTMVAGLEAFNRQVSHDLRGPLAGATSLSKLALEQLRQGRVEQVDAMLQALALQSDRMQALVDDLLALSRVADGEPCLEWTPMRRAVDDAIELLRCMPGPGADLARVTLLVDPLPMVLVDRGLMRQAWANLLANAARFAAHAAAAPAVRIGCREDAGELRFTVDDNGPGFPADRGAELFQDFVRLHGQELSHNGIGLAIVRRVVERHGGRVGAKPGTGGGATFWFTLAAEPAPSGTAPRSDDSRP